jgi:glycerol dehydrogenase
VNARAVTATGTVRVFGGPPRYVQGAGALDLLPEAVAEHGGVPMVVVDPYVDELVGGRLRSLLPNAVICTLDGEVTAAHADALAAEARSADRGDDGTRSGVGVVVGFGGGKALDLAKATALRLNRPVITVPTAASNDSPASAAIAMYDDRHVMVGVDRLPRNPATVLVDTALIARAPIGLLRAGIGDAISKAFEARACLEGTGSNAFGTRPLLIGVRTAQACYDTIRRHAAAGLAAVERGELTDDVEHLVEAVILMSGLGFENGGLSLAHSLTRGLMPARGASSAPHGQHVAWGLLVQLAAEGRDDERKEIADFLDSLGLPTTLAGLGLPDPTAAEIDEIVRLTMRAPHLANLAEPVGAHALRDAILAVEAG